MNSFNENHSPNVQITLSPNSILNPRGREKEMEKKGGKTKEKNQKKQEFSSFAQIYKNAQIC